MVTHDSVRLVPLSESYFEEFRQVLDAVARERRYIAITQAPPLDKVVGWCDVLRTPHEGMGHNGRLGIGLLPEYRGCGLGRRLLGATIGAARAQGVTRIELEVFESNPTAIALYESAGFRTEWVKPGARVLDGISDDIRCMALN